MLLENLQVGFHPKLFELIILEMMDPGRRHSKIKNELIKIYLGEGDQAGLTMDMIPQQDSRRRAPSAGRADTAGGA